MKIRSKELKEVTIFDPEKDQSPNIYKVQVLHTKTDHFHYQVNINYFPYVLNKGDWLILDSLKNVKEVIPKNLQKYYEVIEE